MYLNKTSNTVKIDIKFPIKIALKSVTTKQTEHQESSML